ncbi:DsbA family protein [Pseudomonas sp. NPDC088368]|uniref:DsbA family protein n=1 Tax=Pseudomonas sp. NPDC088368 TaxID=3364453 RepID=UPI00381A543D
MKKIRSLGLLFSLAIVAEVLCFFVFRDSPATRAVPQSLAGPWTSGSETARFTITEYADLECPFCKEYFPVLRSWVDRHPDVNLEWHHLPLSMHDPVASHEARLTECVGSKGGNAAFWATVDLIYQQTRSNGQGLANGVPTTAEPKLANYLEQCAKPDISIGLRIQTQANQARSEGITATPTIVIRDKQTRRSIKLIGASNDDALMSAIDWLAASGTDTTRQASIGQKPSESLH